MFLESRLRVCICSKKPQDRIETFQFTHISCETRGIRGVHAKVSMAHRNRSERTPPFYFGRVVTVIPSSSHGRRVSDRQNVIILHQHRANKAWQYGKRNS